MRNLLLLSLLVLPLTSCAVAGAAAGAVAVNQMGNNNTYVTTVNVEAKQAWNTTKQFLAEESTELIEYDDATRIAKANIDDSRVTVLVEAWDVDRSHVTVSAKRFMGTMNDGKLAEIISERLVRRINQ